MADYLIAPSILSADFARLGEEVDAVLAAGAVVRFPRAATLLAVVAVLESIWIHPHELMYYNAAAGGPRGGACGGSRHRSLRCDGQSLRAEPDDRADGLSCTASTWSDCGYRCSLDGKPGRSAYR